MEVRFRLWFEEDTHVIAGSGRIRLLEAIKAHGSISKAASSMNLSYKKAWKLIDSLNSSTTEPLIITTTGGAGGGGAILSDKALVIIEQYKKAHQTLTNTCDELETLFNK